MDFGLSSNTLEDSAKKLWPYTFSIIYSVTLTPESLSTSIVVTNDGDQPIEFQTLMHTYLKVDDVSKIQVKGLEDAPYVDKVDGAKTKTQEGAITITGETDRVYTPAKAPSHAIQVAEEGETVFTVVRDNLKDVVVWNPWTDKAGGMADFEPKDGFKNMICVEAGSVNGWITLDPGDAFEGAQTISD